MAEDRFDGLFMTVVQQGQGIDSFLDSFFGFLRRRTDFYKDEQEGEKLIMNFLKKHNDLYKDDRRRDEERKRKEAARKQQEEEERAKRQAQAQEPKVVEITDEEETKVPQEEIKSPPKVEEITDETKEEGEDSDNEPGQIPVNNGGTADNYYWTQTLSEVNIMIKISKDVRGRDCQVAATVETLRVAVKGEVLIQGEFYKKIKPDDLVWTIDTIDGERVLQITFDKFEGMNWWKSVIKGHPEINTKKIQAEDSKLSDLDSETRQTVEKMMEDQKRKAMGLPTVEEEQKRDMLKKFMDAHPEMDFSKAKFS